MRTFALALAGVLLLSACQQPGDPTETFVLASTTSTQDSGLLDALVPAFEETVPRLQVKVVAVGSGEAIDLGRRGDADVLLVHSPSAEETFMAEGHGVDRRAVMQNDFVIAGAPEDPAGIASAADAADAFRRIAQAETPFISRGDESGTHQRELRTWEQAGIAPSGGWYLSSGQGMAETIAIAAESGAYLLTDTATFTVAGSTGSLEVLFDGDPTLENPYSVIVVTKARHPEAARMFADWITGPDGQQLIGDFGWDRFGKSLFIPTSGQ